MNAPYNLIVALSATYTTNILNPTAPVYILVTHVRVNNNTGAAVTFRMFKGLTGANTAGTECFFPQNKSVPANDSVDWYGQMIFKSTDFLVGGASAGSNSLTLEIDGEQAVDF